MLYMMKICDVEWSMNKIKDLNFNGFIRILNIKNFSILFTKSPTSLLNSCLNPFTVNTKP